MDALDAALRRIDERAARKAERDCAERTIRFRLRLAKWHALRRALGYGR